MATATRPARSTGQRPPRSDWGTRIRTKGSGLPSRVVLHGVEGVGKTSFAAHAPKPVVLMARGETGLETLIDSGRLPDTPHLPELGTWSEVLSAVDWLTEEEHGFKTCVIDTLNGVERLCHEHVCERDFSGDWGERGFIGYQRGFEVSLADWREFLRMLDRLREKRRMALIALVHTKVANFKNPEGPDYDRYSPDLNGKTWSLTHKWADIVLFGNFYTEVKAERGRKGKGLGGQQRVLYTTRHAAYDAKNRHGLPEEISMGGSGAEAWSNFVNALKNGRK